MKKPTTEMVENAVHEDRQRSLGYHIGEMTVAAVQLGMVDVFQSEALKPHVAIWNYALKAEVPYPDIHISKDSEISE